MATAALAEDKKAKLELGGPRDQALELTLVSFDFNGNHWSNSFPLDGRVDALPGGAAAHKRWLTVFKSRAHHPATSIRL
ncbi:hypothetical protein K3217_21585 [bacterium BD-1]|nr:hypothetical protein [Ottowia caeni]